MASSNSVDTILNYFTKGFQKSNRFEVNIGGTTEVVNTGPFGTTPPGGSSSTSGSSTTGSTTGLTAAAPTKFWASSVQIPSQDVTYYPENFGPSTPMIKIPVRRGYDDRFLIEFIVESNWAVRKYFETWIASIFTNPGKIKTIDSGYLRKIDIIALNDTSNDGSNMNNAKFTLHDAYPKLLLQSEFNNNTPNQYVSLIVDFNYRYYTFS